MIFRVKPGGKVQAFAHDGRPLGGQTAFHYLMFRATVSTPDGKTLFTKIPSNTTGDTKKSDIRLLQMRQLMARVVQEGLDYCFRLSVPRASKAATVLVPTEESGGVATRVRAPGVGQGKGGSAARVGMCQQGTASCARERARPPRRKARRRHSVRVALVPGFLREAPCWPRERVPNLRHGGLGG